MKEPAQKEPSDGNGKGLCENSESKDGYCPGPYRLGCIPNGPACWDWEANDRLSEIEINEKESGK